MSRICCVQKWSKYVMRCAISLVEAWWSAPPWPCRQRAADKGWWRLPWNRLKIKALTSSGKYSAFWFLWIITYCYQLYITNNIYAAHLCCAFCGIDSLFLQSTIEYPLHYGPLRKNICFVSFVTSFLFLTRAAKRASQPTLQDPAPNKALAQFATAGQKQEYDPSAPRSSKGTMNRKRRVVTLLWHFEAHGPTPNWIVLNRPLFYLQFYTILYL